MALSSNNTAVVIPATLTIPANASNGNFTATLASLPTNQTATMTVSVGGSSSNSVLQLTAATMNVSVSRTSVAFPDITVKSTATQGLTLSSTGTLPVTLSAATVTNGFFRPRE